MNDGCVSPIAFKNSTYRERRRGINAKYVCHGLREPKAKSHHCKHYVPKRDEENVKIMML